MKKKDLATTKLKQKNILLIKSLKQNWSGGE